MASYEIEWKHSAEKDINDIDRQYIPRILEAVESLSNNPFPSQHRKRKIRTALKKSENRNKIIEYR